MHDQVENEMDLQAPYNASHQFSPDAQLNENENESPHSDPEKIENAAQRMSSTDKKNYFKQTSESKEGNRERNHLAPLQLKDENKHLKEELEKQKKKLAKTEEKLEKKRAFIKDMSSLQNDISQIKKSTKDEIIHT